MNSQVFVLDVNMIATVMLRKEHVVPLVWIDSAFRYFAEIPTAMRHVVLAVRMEHA